MTDPEPARIIDGEELSEALARLKETLGEQDFEELTRQIAASGNNPWEFLSRFYTAIKQKEAKEKHRAAELVEAARQAQAAAEAAQAAAEAAAEAAAQRGGIYALYQQPQRGKTAAELAAEAEQIEEEPQEDDDQMTFSGLLAEVDKSEEVEGEYYHDLEHIHFPMGKVSQKTSAYDVTGKTATPVKVSKRGKIPQYLKVSIEIPEDIIKTNRKIMPEDKLIEAAIGTLMEMGYNAASTRTIYLVAHGKKQEEYVSPEELKRTEKIIEKLSKTYGSIVFPDELKKQYRINDITLEELHGNLIWADHAILKYPNGKRGRGWLFGKRSNGAPRLPLFFNCSKVMGQIARIPSECLNVKQIVAGEEKPRKQSPEFSNLKTFIITEVCKIKRQKRAHTDTETSYIKIQKIIDELDLAASKKDKDGNPRPMTRAEVQRLKNDVITILEHLKRTPKKKPYIRGYTIKKIGNQIDRFDIDP